jgi:hypothetical protein
MSPSTESSRLSRRSTKQASGGGGEGGGGARRRRGVVLWRLDSVLAAFAAAVPPQLRCSCSMSTSRWPGQ